MSIPRKTRPHTVATLHSRCIEEGDCWIWQGATDGHGKPQVRHHGATMYVRRLVRELADGRKIPTGKVVACKCGTAKCVAPAHMVITNHQGRADLAKARGAYLGISRQVKMANTKRAQSHITEQVVQAIRNADSSRQAASQFGVSLSHCKAIRRGTARVGANPFAGLMA